MEYDKWSRVIQVGGGIDASQCWSRQNSDIFLQPLEDADPCMHPRRARSVTLKRSPDRYAAARYRDQRVS